MQKHEVARANRRVTSPAEKWWKTEGVCGTPFGTKESLVEAIRGIINTQDLGAPLGLGSQEFLVDVLRHHHDWVGKRGAGLKHLEVRMNPGTFGSTRGLWIKRIDGTEVDISWVVALKPGGQSSHKENVVAAARREIWDQVNAARDAQEGKCCPLCGEPLLVKTHVDHAHPWTFDALLTEFLRTYGHSWESIGVEDCGLYGIFDDRGLAADWHHFHAQLADLRLIHAHENLSMGARG